MAKKEETKLQRLHREYKAAVKAAFEEGSAELFAKYPRLKSFGWINRNNYWNDGEETPAYATTNDPSINGYGGYVEVEDNQLENLFNASDKEAKAIVKAVTSFLEEIGDDFLLNNFSEDTLFTVTKDGIEETENQDY